MGRGLLRWALAGVLVTSLVLAARAQNAPPAQAPPAPPASEPAQPAQGDQGDPSQLPTFRTELNLVRVDVIVSDKQGNPVGDLRQQDFEVLEDGKPQSIQTFKLINITDTQSESLAPPRQIRSVADEQAEANREDTRLFAFFLDDYHVRLENSMRARDLLADFAANQLQATDMAGVMYPLTPLSDVLLTRNRGSVSGAIRSFTGRKYDYTARNLIEERYVHYVSTMEAERIRNQVTLSALKGLIIRLGGLREGRKAIILISEGYTNSLPAQAQDPIASMPGSGGPSRPDPVGGAANSPAQMRMESQEFFLQTDLLTDIKSVTDLANRYNTAIYAVDPRGLTPFEFDLSRPNVSMTKDQKLLDNTMDTLRIMADNTDGRAIVNQNDLLPGLKQIVRDSSAYYLLGYTTSKQLDGKFHEIQVKVKRPGVQVRARKGYLALNATEAERILTPPKAGPPKMITEALGALSVPARRSPIRSWLGMSPGANGKTKISFVWAPAAPRAGARMETPAKISLIAGSANSDLYYRGRDLVPGKVEFEVPPGQVELEIAVMDAGTDVIDRETRKIDVPAMGLGLTISTPQIFRGRTLPEWQKLATDQTALPETDREFRRTDRLLVRVGAQSAGGTPTITARLLNREGGEMSTLPVSAAAFGGLSHIDVSLAALPPGDFIIEIKAAEGPETTLSLLAIRVTS